MKSEANLLKTLSESQPVWKIWASFYFRFRSFSPPPLKPDSQNTQPKIGLSNYQSVNKHKVIAETKFTL